ncbi:MAG: GTPase Era [Clostridiales bacterium]|nr:GTPase Era [Clostridiales bacterium]HBM81252.1 GTPase Era [Clostridiaceae bacterium]
MFKSGFVTIAGRPNVGKSTLMNRFLGEKVSIVSNKPQTTRNNLQTVLTEKNYQIVFIDTPGIHRPRHRLGEYMVKAAQNTFNDADIILFMITPSKEINAADSKIIEHFRDENASVILTINKVDEYTKEELAKTIDIYKSLYDFKEIVPISALKGINTDTLLKILVENLPEGPKYFPDDVLTNQNKRFLVSEIIREKALQFLREEVPHGIAVEVEHMKREEKKNLIDISAVIYCEKESHKSIIIGKDGRMLKNIGIKARADIEKILDSKVYLNLWVKVNKDWRDDPSSLKRLGYSLKA